MRAPRGADPPTRATVNFGGVFMNLGRYAEAQEHDERVGHRARMNARFRLWELTQDNANLTEAHRLLEHLREHAPAEYRDSMLQNVPLHRDIMKAWEEHGEKR